MSRTPTLTGSLGLGEKVLASPAERRLAAAVEDGLELVEERLRAEVRFADPMADAMSRYLLEAGGKRVRPTLALLTAQLGGGVVPDVVTGAAAVELTHLASLYHDDVMDEAELRRGVPVAQSVWGNSVAILAGDLLFARAGKLIASLGAVGLDLHARTFERLCLGQLHETLGPQGGEDPVAHYLQVLADKTGSLIAASSQIGVLYSGAPDEFRAAAEVFGERVGVAFQLVDDVIDLSAETEQTGKRAGTDLLAGIPTLPLIHLRRMAAEDAASAELLARIERDVDAEEGAVDDPAASADFAAAIAQLRAHPATQATLEEARRWAAEAVAALAPLPEGPVKKALTRFADAIVERSN
ncbi:polyprenyl synthetase family protein [Homoserinibacter sp. YIM 151385]|uniref:polyprenyl synthetase family protein n=1 Tax=Homoserinibacter sp. YIM 151385 TaxID=2985506 RepID=UPI0022F129C0|nr:polyprenyl synthetase family protein [Homoserinibacter sp. YIM 151385]WBU36987.1 polyprenyl synthetase family protein [Homoserinibacter sp. YIM 151385]